MPFILKVICFNIKIAEKSSIEQIASFIRSHNPDIAFLQEVKKDSSIDQASELSRRTGLSIYFIHLGVTILSRFKFYPKVWDIYRPPFAPWPPGFIIEARISVPGVNRL